MTVMWYWGGSGVHWWGWLIGALVMLAFWALVIWAVWYLVANWVRRPPGEARPPEGGDPGSARRILDERLARGEIGDDEYRRLRDLLREHSSSTARMVGTPDRPAAPSEDEVVPAKR